MYFDCILFSGGGFWVCFGVYFGAQRVFVFSRGRRRLQLFFDCRNSAQTGCVAKGRGPRGSEKHTFLAILFFLSLEAQQRYFSYRAILVAIVSQNSLVLVFIGVSHNYRAIRCKMWLSHGCVSVKLSAKGGYRTNWGEC